jgi:transcriptional regulator of acetoin/glycerol metabolism
VVLLAKKFLSELGVCSTELCMDVVRLLRSYHWPGNVRELRSSLEYASLMSAQDQLRVEHFPRRIRAEQESQKSDVSQLMNVVEVSAPTSDSLVNSPADDLVAESLRSFKDFERNALVKALERHDGNVSAVARSLGIGRTTVYRKLKQLELVSD